jgi:hypothetical protein
MLFALLLGMALDFLAMWRWMPVIARNSSFAYRGKAQQKGTQDLDAWELYQRAAPGMPVSTPVTRSKRPESCHLRRQSAIRSSPPRWHRQPSFGWWNPCSDGATRPKLSAKATV